MAPAAMGSALDRSESGLQSRAGAKWDSSSCAGSVNCAGVTIRVPTRLAPGTGEGAPGGAGGGRDRPTEAADGHVLVDEMETDERQSTPGITSSMASEKACSDSDRKVSQAAESQISTRVFAPTTAQSFVSPA